MALPENGYIQLIRATDEDGNPARVSQIAGVYRLAVDALIAAGGPFIVETDDDAIPAAQDVLLALTMGQVYDGTTWRRVAGGTDNAAAGVAAGRTGQYIAGIARAALVAYTDGDVAIPTFDLAGRMMVNTGGIAVEDDDDNIVASQAHETTLPLNYGYDSVDGVWRRFQLMTPNTILADEQLLGLYTLAFARGINSSGAVGSQGVMVEGRAPGTTPLDERLYGLYSLAFVRGLNSGAVAGSQGVAVEGRAPGTTPLDERLYGLYSLAFVRGINSGAAAGSQGVAVEARPASDDGVYASTLTGLLVNSRISAWNAQTGNWSILNSIGTTNLDGYTAAVGALFTNSINVGVDATGAEVFRKIQARAPGTSPLDERLYGLYSLAFVRGINSGAAAGSQGVGVEARLASTWNALAETTPNLLGTLAKVAGVDNTSGAVIRAVEARNADDGGDYTNTLIGLLVNNRPSYWLVGASPDWTRVMGNLFTAANGVLIDNAVHGPYSVAGMFGYDSSGPNLRAIQARAPGTTPLDERLYGMYSLAFVRALDLSGAAGSQGVGVGAVGSASVSSSSLEAAFGLAVVQARDSGFAAAKRGKRFYITNSSMYSYGTLLAAQTAFAGTTPALLLRVDSASIRSIVRQISLAIGNTPGGVVYIAVHLDTTDRYSSGGVAVTPSNTNEESATAAVAKFYENPTATATGATARPLCSTLAPATPGTTVQISFSDGVLLGPSAASLLVYVWAASTAPQILYTVEEEEVT